MTSGLQGDSTASWQPGTYDVPLRFTRVWNGSDGKYEAYAGGLRDKWNPFTCRIDSRYIIKANYTRVRYNGQVVTTASATIDGRMQDVSSYPLSGAEQNRLLDKLVSDVKGHSFNLGVNLGQMGQTINTVSSTLDSLGRSFSALKRGNFLGAVSALGIASTKRRTFKSKDVSGRWLELQYGWLPLLSDSYEASKAFESLSKGPRSSLFVKSYSKKVVRTSYPVAGNEIFYTYSGTRFRRLEFQLYEVMSAPRSLGLQDPLSVAWELIPYSFVVDWFIPIGTYLSNLNQVPALNGRWLVTDGVRWPRNEIVWGFVPGSSSNSFNYKTCTSFPRVAYRSTSVVRSLGAPSIVRPGFDFRGAIHGKRFWNAIALAHQRFKG
jgi:hypothetical protein